MTLHRRFGAGPLAVDVAPVAPGVHVARGGAPHKTMNAYLVDDGDGVLLFDAGIASMAKGLRAAADALGGLTRVVLGHAHGDHRGAAAELGAPVICHADAVAAAEGDGGHSTFDFTQLDRFKLAGRYTMPLLLRLWDGGPVPVAGTLAEGDDVAGFRVVAIPGHAAGQIALWREHDGVVLTTDLFYLLDPQTGRPAPAQLPHRAFTPDVELARASLLEVADLGPATALPGHLGPLTGDVRAQLLRAADRS